MRLVIPGAIACCDDEVMGEARERTADQDQERHGEKRAAVSLKHVVRARRAQDVDQRADEAQDRDFDQMA